jgi:hypothetical protein
MRALRVLIHKISRSSGLDSSAIFREVPSLSRVDVHQVCSFSRSSALAKMASVSGDYEEDWEVPEPAVDKKSVVSATEGQVFPLSLTRDAEPTQEEETCSPELDNTRSLEGKLQVGVGDFTCVTVKANPAVSNVASVELPTSEDALSSMESEKTITPEFPPPQRAAKDESEQLFDLVRIHGHHHNRQTPPPVPIQVASEIIREEKSPRSVDIGALHARIAAKRIAEFRRTQSAKEARERALETAWVQKRREVRRSNDAMYKQLGVAGLSAQDHLRLAQRRRKQEMKQKEISANRERQNQCRNAMPKRPSSAPDHIRELQMRHSRENRERERKERQQSNSIRENQQKLRQQAHAIITKKNGAYIHGSYLLKVTRHTIKLED